MFKVGDKVRFKMSRIDNYGKFYKSKLIENKEYIIQGIDGPHPFFNGEDGIMLYFDSIDLISEEEWNKLQHNKEFNNVMRDILSE